jgi:hypothetical protein
MYHYLTRIELHKAVFPDDYNALHREMLLKGFTNSILADNGKAFELPTAEYHIISNSSLEHVYKLAEDAANSIGKKYWIITTLFTSAKMELKEIKPQTSLR